MTLADRVRNAITTTVRRIAPCSPLFTLAGMGVALHNMISAEKYSSDMLLPQVALPIAAGFSAMVALDLGKNFILNSKKVQKTTLDDLLAKPDQPAIATRRPYPIIAATTLALARTASIAYDHAHKLPDFTWSQDMTYLAKATSPATPATVALAGVTYAILGLISRRSRESLAHRLYYASAGIAGGAYAGIAHTLDEPTSLTAALASAFAGVIAYSTLSLISKRPTPAQVKTAIAHIKNLGHARNTNYGRAGELFDSINDLDAERYDEIFIRLSHHKTGEGNHVHPLAEIPRQAGLAFTRAHARLYQFSSPRNPQFDLVRAAVEQSAGDSPLARTYLDVALWKAKHYSHHLEPETRIMHALATGEWDEHIPALLQNPTITTRKLGRSDHEVSTIDPATRKFLSTMFAIKTSTRPDDLLNERDACTSIKTKHSSRGTVEILYTSPQPNSTGKYTLVSRFAAGPTLDQTSDPAHVINAAGFLGELHYQLVSKFPERNYRQVLLERLTHDSLDRYRPDIIHSWDALWQHCHGVAHFDKDPQGKNWIVSADKLIALDYDDKGETDQTLQLGKLVGHHPTFCDNIENIVRAIDSYSEEDCARIDRQPLFVGTLASIPLLALNSHYFSSQGRADASLTCAYLKNARHALTFGRNELGWTQEPYTMMERIICAIQETSYLSSSQNTHKSTA